MAKARALDKRRKSIRNIRKITRTMELIATARFKKAMDRATAATAYTQRITQLVADLAGAGLQVSHPLLESRAETQSVTLLVLTANRGLCGGYNGNVSRLGLARWKELRLQVPQHRLEVSGKRGIGAFRYRLETPNQSYTHFDDKAKFEAIEVLANRFLDEYITGKLDRLDVVYTRFGSISKQTPVVETLLPLGNLAGAVDDPSIATGAARGGKSLYDFLPSAESILEEIVPASFKVKLFKCFLDAAVSEQIARMIAMKAATENAGELIKQLSMTYNRARQSQITGEIMEIIGGVEALNK
jgi:F-type H+-transporting ATPase subunit gamma